MGSGTNSSYDPNKLGWGAALITCALTAGLGFTAWSIHKSTYRHPRDPMFQQVYHQADAAKHDGGHAPAEANGEAKGEAKGEEHGEHAAPAAEGAKH